MVKRGDVWLAGLIRQPPAKSRKPALSDHFTGRNPRPPAHRHAHDLRQSPCRFSCARHLPGRQWAHPAGTVLSARQATARQAPRFRVRRRSQADVANVARTLRRVRLRQAPSPPPSASFFWSIAAFTVAAAAAAEDWSPPATWTVGDAKTTPFWTKASRIIM